MVVVVVIVGIRCGVCVGGDDGSEVDGDYANGSGDDYEGLRMWWWWCMWW